MNFVNKLKTIFFNIFICFCHNDFTFGQTANGLVPYKSVYDLKEMELMLPPCVWLTNVCPQLCQHYFKILILSEWLQSASFLLFPDCQALSYLLCVNDSIQHCVTAESSTGERPRAITPTVSQRSTAQALTEEQLAAQGPRANPDHMADAVAPLCHTLACFNDQLGSLGLD